MGYVPRENHQGITIAAVEASVALLATIAICLRVWARKLKGARLDASDWTCIAGLVSGLYVHRILTDLIMCVALGLFSFNVWSVTMGLGLLPPTPKAGQDPHVIPPSPVRTYRTIMIEIYLWTTSNSLVRISAALLYFRLFPNRKIRFICYVFIVLNVAYILGTYIAVALLCYPNEPGWLNRLPPARCNGNRQRLFLGHGIINLLFDVTVITIPMPALWKIQLPTRRKLPLIGVFAIGLFVCSIMITRTIELQTMSVQHMNADPMLIHLLTTPEPFLGIICCCLPILRPIARKFRSTLSRGSKPSSEKSSKQDNPDTIGRQGKVPPMDPHAIDTKDLFAPEYREFYQSGKDSSSGKGSFNFGLPPVVHSVTVTRWEREVTRELR